MRPGCRCAAGAVLVGLAIAVLLLACEESTGKPAATAQPVTPATPAEPTTPAQSSTCVPNVAIHRTNTGGAIQGAIKDLVLYWGGTQSNVECLPDAQQNQRQLNRVGNTQAGTATYRVIRVQRPAGARYYMLKYLDGEPVCIIDVAGACDRMLSGLGDYDVETLPAEVPALDGSRAPPPAPAPTPPQSTVPPEVVTGGTDYVVGTQATLGSKAARNTLRAIVATDSGALTVAATENDPDGHLGTITSEGGVLTITGIKSTWDASANRHNPIRIDFTATNAGGLQAGSWIQIVVDGAPELENANPPRSSVTKATGISKVLVRDLASFYSDPEGESVSVVEVSSSPATGGTASISDGHLTVIPNNPGVMTITYYVTSTSNPSGNAPQYARDTVTVTILPN